MLLINNFSEFSRQDIYVWSVPAYPIPPKGNIQPEKKDGANGPVLIGLSQGRIASPPRCRK
jgi:hypothetical protein